MSAPPNKDLITILLAHPVPERERPTDDHYTLEVNVYWRDDFFETVSAGRRRSLVVDGYKPWWKADLQVELPHAWSRFVLARLKERQAILTVAEGAEIGLRQTDGTIARDMSLLNLPQTRAPFPARALTLAFGQRFAMQIESLTFVAQFVRLDGPPRQRFDWLLSRIPGLNSSYVAPNRAGRPG